MNTPTENINPLRLSRFHFGLAVFYGLLAICTVFAARYFPFMAFPEIKLIILAIYLMPLVHLGLAMGCRKKNELARKLSVAVGILMLLAFPVGTILAFYLLPLTEWNKPKASHS